MTADSKVPVWESELPATAATVDPVAAGTDVWRLLRYFNLYRATLSGLIITLAAFGIAPRYFGQTAADVFWTTAGAYFAFSILCGFAIRSRWGSAQLQVVAQVFGDIVAITLMMHASGGVASGFGMLLVATIAGGSILTQGRIAILFAAMASLAVLADQLYEWWFLSSQDGHYSQAGMLGITFFATALLGYFLARRIRISEALAAQRGVDLASLARLNEHIIQRMQSGVMVLDADNRVRLLNGSATHLLGVSADVTGQPLSVFAPQLTELESRWRQERAQASHLFRPERGPVDVLASFAVLGREGSVGALVYLEDASAMRQRAQQLKLASLGRLTASIAHEIRNPLGAISHASQLLAESSGLAQAEHRLLQIIDENSERMNAIVENILQLSRRKEAIREDLDLDQWLNSFIDELLTNRELDPEQIQLIVERPGLVVQFDSHQLHQVLWNLCENGLRHGGDPARLTLRIGVSDGVRPFLDVADHGVGIVPDKVEHLFEPFYTTDPRGTGLGLYIARELCEINQASIGLIQSEYPGCCFRINFSDPRRRRAPQT